MTVGDVAPQIALALGAVAVLLVSLVVPRRRQTWCAAVAVAALATAGALIGYLAITRPTRLSMSEVWALDGVTSWVSAVIVATAALVVLMSPRWFARDRRHGEWYVMVLLSSLGSTLLAGAADLSQLVVAVLLSSATGTALASFHRASPMSVEAGAKRFFLGALASPMLFLGAVILYGVAGSTGYPELAAAFASPDVSGLAVAAGGALVLIGLLFELGAFPAHPWVPDVAQGSPAPAAALLTVAPKVGALVAIARLASLLPDPAIAWRPAVAVIAVATMTLGNLAALWQSDVRRLLGWSAVSQAGYGLLAVVALGRSSLAIGALVMFAVGYAAANLAAFAVVTSLRGRTDIADYRGLLAARPGHALALALALFSLFGVPPLAGFAAKLALFGAAIDAGYSWLAVVAVINTAASMFYYLRVIAATMSGAPSRRVALLGSGALAAVAASTLVVLAAGIGAELIIATAPAALLP